MVYLSKRDSEACQARKSTSKILQVVIHKLIGLS